MFPVPEPAATRAQVARVVLSGLNQFGAIAGIYSDANSVYHGFVRSPQGKFTRFNVPGAGTGANQGTGCFSDCAVGLNDWGAVAGNFIDASNNYHTFLRSPQGAFTTIDPKGSADTFFAALNDWGIVIGAYIDANNVYHGFVALP